MRQIYFEKISGTCHNTVTPLDGDQMDLNGILNGFEENKWRCDLPLVLFSFFSTAFVLLETLSFVFWGFLSFFKSLVSCFLSISLCFLLSLCLSLFLCCFSSLCVFSCFLSSLALVGLLFTTFFVFPFDDLAVQIVMNTRRIKITLNLIVESTPEGPKRT